jgi:hypothetical protein
MLQLLSYLIFTLAMAFSLANLPAQAQTDNSGGVAASVSTGTSAIFHVGRSYRGKQFSDSIAVGDFNSDHKLDIVVTNEEEGPAVGGDVNIFLGNGDGTLQPSVEYHAGNGAAHSVAVADLNRDRKDDLVVSSACAYERTFGFYFCEAHTLLSVNGTFPDYDLQWLYWPLAVAVGEFNGDGIPDFAIAQVCLDSNPCKGQPAAVSVFLGPGSNLLSSYPVGGLYGYSVAVGDLNRDHKDDLIVGSSCADTACTTGLISILIGNGDGTFQPAVTYASASRFGWYDRQMAVADLNADGRLDVVNDAGVLLGNGDGTLQPEIPHLGGGGAIAVADFNGDGTLDLATTQGLLLGLGDGTFSAPTGDVIGGTSLATGDFNHDGKPDLVVLRDQYTIDSSRITMLLNIAKGFRYATTTTLRSSLNPAPSGQVVTFTATVKPAFGGGITGQIYFKDGDVVLGSAPVFERSASFSTGMLAAGSHSIVAIYAGNESFLPSASKVLRQKISP